MQEAIGIGQYPIQQVEREFSGAEQNERLRGRSQQEEGSNTRPKKTGYCKVTSL